MRSAASVLVPLVLAACAPAGIETGSGSAPIIGGVPSSDSDFPATGVLLARLTNSDFGQMVCTGTLIAPDVVLTAAHCTIDFFGGALPLEYFFSFTLDVSTFGQNSTALPPRTTKVRKLLPHPDFDINELGGMGGQPPRGLGDYEDIGLLFLEARVDDVVPSVVTELDDDPRITQGSEVLIAGYGARENGGMEAGIKYHATSIINELGASEMQIGDLPPVPQKCHGDSGGPTFLDIDDGLAPRQRIVGVTSRAYDEADCGKGGVDTRIHGNHTWLNDMMVAHCNDGTRVACENGGILPTPAPLGADSGVIIVPDAGFIDSGAVESGDAGFAADADPVVLADATPRDAVSPGNTFRSRNDEGGCGCSSGRSPSSTSLAVTFGALALIFAARRRR